MLRMKFGEANVLEATYIHTYIHNWPVQSFSQDYGLASHNTHAVCVYFLREWRNLHINVNSERQIFKKLFHGRFISLSEFLPEICWDEVAEEIFFIFNFWCLACGSNPGFMSNKPTHYLLDYVDFAFILISISWNFSTHIQSLKYSSYRIHTERHVLCYWFRLSIAQHVVTQIKTI